MTSISLTYLTPKGKSNKYEHLGSKHMTWCKVT